jgi:hypothetical protein
VIRARDVIFLTQVGLYKYYTQTVTSYEGARDEYKSMELNTTAESLLRD